MCLPTIIERNSEVIRVMAALKDTNPKRPAPGKSMLVSKKRNK